MKKYAFFKYFIKNRVFAGGGGAGLGDPSPLGLGLGLGVQILPPIWFGDGDGAGAWKWGQGWGCLNPPPIRPVVMSKSSRIRRVWEGFHYLVYCTQSYPVFYTRGCFQDLNP